MGKYLRNSIQFKGTQETIEMLHSNIDAFYKQEVTREVKPFKKKKPYPRD